MSETVLFAIEGSIARLTLNRPTRSNVIDLALARALFKAAIRCDTDPAIRCVVLTGAGNMFCAGGDLAVFSGAGKQVPALLSELAGTLHMAICRLMRMPKPLVVLVNGPAAGAGCSLAIAGDIVLAAPAAHFTVAYNAIGLTPDGGMSWLLPRLVGLRKAQEMILTNRRVNAAEAESIGLVTRVVAEGALDVEGNAIADTLSRSATSALGVVRALLLESSSEMLEAQLEKEARAITAAGGNAESEEGIAAYGEKRKPNFKRTNSYG
jgi:2-(1,2-epoxy-1,2-dihydrophenyl)acetyl-CoA isomerase